MKQSIIVLAIAAVLALSVASPAFADSGRDFGYHHSRHAIAEGGFTAEHNPGVKHQGYSGWMAE